MTGHNRDVIQAFGVASLLIIVTYLYNWLHQKRFKHNASIPQHPTSLIWGHLRVFDKFTQQGAADRHPDAILDTMHRDLGQPAVMVVDFWPINPPLVVVTTHDIAEQISRSSKDFHYSVPKAPSIERLVHLIGTNSILIKQDEQWKAVRKRFNPGFAPNHLVTLLPCVIEKATYFLKNLDRVSRTNDVFLLTHLTTSLTFDIIGAVVMDVDLNAQCTDSSKQGTIIRLYKDLIQTFADDKIGLPWWLQPLVILKRRTLAAQMTEQLEMIVASKFRDLKEGKHGNRSRTVLTLSLQDVETLTPDILSETCDQLKTFLFAGHDTTSILLDWTFYELSRTPHAMQEIRAELDRLFGRETSPAHIAHQFLSPGGEELLYRMPYTSAVIKEVLRLHPPAGSVRMAKPGAGLTISTPEGNFCLDGNYIYLNHAIIQRDRAIYGDTADDFIPERWLNTNEDGEGDKTFTSESGKFPASAWRAFERGPRNCIGQELANIEARVIIAMTIRRYKFTKIGLGELDLIDGQPILGANNQYKAKSELYSAIQVTARPVDGMRVRVELADGASVLEQTTSGNIDIAL